MSHYIIAIYDVVDEKVYEPYVPGVVPLLQKHKAEILVADYDSKSLEGEGRGVIVVLQFPDEEAAMNWYNDPEYAEVKKHRLNASANSAMHSAKQFVFPS